MGILNSNKYPIPSSWNEFEHMVFDIFSSKYSGMASNRCGRQGQKQKGLDIVLYNNIKKIGIQCKNISKFGVKDLDNIISAIAIDLDMIIIAVTTPKDIVTLEYAITKSNDINKIIQIFYWDDIINLLSTYGFIQKYYPEFFQSDNFELKQDRLLFKNFFQDFNDSGLRKYLQELQAEHSISDEAMSIFFNLTEKWSQINFMFHNKDLENERIKFIEIIDKLANFIAFNTWSCNDTYHSVPREWRQTDPDRYEETVKLINKFLLLFNTSFNTMIYVAKKNGIF